jgi:alginate O-acetyltransferase complex protein AlgI
VIFSSYTYVAFLALAWGIHTLLGPRFRNAFLIVTSYFFYATWGLSAVPVLLAITCMTYVLGLTLAKAKEPERWLPWSVGVLLLPLLYFKYRVFLWSMVLGAFGRAAPDDTLTAWAPLGISFFTFQAIAYLVDVSTGEPPIRKVSEFFLFKAFWPQLVNGPIIRPGEIAEALAKRETPDADSAIEAWTRIARGLFKKTVIADMLGPYVELVFAPHARLGMADAWAGTVGFALQIYFDFSAYSDIAIGSARLFGFRFPENFDRPYLARSIQEFWERWHMSLSRWIRDYVFSPLAFAARRSHGLTLASLVFAMALCGLWHGPRWTFVAWGLMHGLALVGERLLGRTPAKSTPIRNFAGWLSTMSLVLFGWVLFRATSLSHAGHVFSSMFAFQGGLRPQALRENALLTIAAVAAVTLALEFAWPRLARLRPDGGSTPAASIVKGLAYATLVAVTLVFESKSTAFVYQQF